MLIMLWAVPAIYVLRSLYKAGQFFRQYVSKHACVSDNLRSQTNYFIHTTAVIGTFECFTVKMTALFNSDADNACGNLDDLVEQIQFLNQASGGSKNGLRSATNQPPSRGSSNNPELGDPKPETSSSTNQPPSPGSTNNPELGGTYPASTSSKRVCIQPLKGLSNLIKSIDTPQCRGDTEKPGCSGITSKNRLKRKNAVGNRTKAKPPVDCERDTDCIPQTPDRKRPRQSFGAIVDVNADDNVVPDVDDVQNWGDGLLESWDACEFTVLPKETQPHVPSDENVAVVAESDPEELPSNQEAFIRESHLNIDTQFITTLIQDTVKSVLLTLEEQRTKIIQDTVKSVLLALEEQRRKIIQDTIRTELLAFERHFTALSQRQQEQGIWIKQSIAEHRLNNGVVRQVARDQGLTTDVLRQVVITLKKRYG
ncbi:uncharacterized protein LOC125280256 [Megalobrama amblycephala]|uniref:uncharacterized protein LOC125280256 n=1 Tax=Megalobrama amblycephala TaxID=75352 RepID=UPI002013D959|nr:uncharacterized protein LOC125280256 [Megalobrama amblycephala]XP_048066611.1 uncharacterized protein LOC125280256 [Megalobrama amblycephala]XP_048066612.1 uncharacterized protein LOC125280256 [Megalobrama amblycephala]XP_048066613.1 uncharacterized protein LOC125280256 [Megalobrama amblycephala]